MKHYFSYTDELIQTLESFASISNAGDFSVAVHVFPELQAFFESGNPNVAALSVEHDQASDNVLWMHLKNVLQKLIAVETQEISRFQHVDALDADHFNDLCDLYKLIYQTYHLDAILRAALVFSDISKGGSVDRREEWQNRLGMDLSIHNEASAMLLQKTALLNRYPEFRHSEVLQKLVIFMVQAHGLMGQFVRGEVTGAAIMDVVSRIRELASELQAALLLDDFEASVRAISSLYLMMNILDTAGVREGLMTNDLLDHFKAVASDIQNAALGIYPFPTNPQTADSRIQRQFLVSRLTSLRSQAIQRGESPENVRNTLDAMDDAQISWLYDQMRACQLWYFEAATGRLSAQSQIKLLIMGLYLSQSCRTNTSEIYHLDLIQIANLLSPKSDKCDAQTAQSRSNYRVRILDALLAMQTIEGLINGSADIYQDEYIFMINGMRGNDRSISLNISVSEESDALITLLSIYERKSAVAFHSALKMLCDLYNLRKDDFDRLSNESQYLVTMNAAKNDKARMLKYLKPGRIVEVGPGGGVVLDLLASHFTDSEIIGLDASHQVVVALEQKKKQTQAKWKIIEGNAFEFQKYFQPESLDNVVFCSILHEIYSYIESEDGSRFHLESVQKMLQSAFEALAPGGRILIRDGIMPEHTPQHLTFLAKDARPFFDAFVREFKGRRIEFQEIGENSVLIDSADAMEFMYTYTWGPESFPYEVREQYGVMTYPDYCKSVLSWLGNRARLVEIPANDALVLQPGYITALKDKVRLTDIDDNPVPFPPSNAMIVVEKV